MSSANRCQRSSSGVPTGISAGFASLASSTGPGSAGGSGRLRIDGLATSSSSGGASTQGGGSPRLRATGSFTANADEGIPAAGVTAGAASCEA